MNTRSILIGLAAAGLAAPGSWAQTLDGTWMATCGNQSVQVAPDVSFRIGHIHFWDTSPTDGLSDLYFEVLLVNSDGSSFARSAIPFRLQAGQTVPAGPLVFTSEPPVQPVALQISVEPAGSVLEAGQSAQLTVMAMRSDGSAADVTSSGHTSYRSSNSAIAAVKNAWTIRGG